MSLAAGLDPRLDAAMAELTAALDTSDALEFRARHIAELMARCLQGALLLRHGVPEVAEAFAATRLSGPSQGAFGTLPAGVDAQASVNASSNATPTADVAEATSGPTWPAA